MTRLILGSLAALTLTASVATAQTAGRCSLVGQMASSVWLEMIQALGDNKAPVVESAITRLDALTATYDRLDCDQDALNAVFDCVLTEDPNSAPRVLLRQCMTKAGIAGE
ncbi:hypothetical protein [Pseudooceanicola sp.]|uniref:hypothetical protein n=1 Tax=Pseudooceanicola sp. TaxID=1914328 RepID=UPI0035C6F480